MKRPLALHIVIAAVLAAGALACDTDTGTQPGTPDGPGDPSDPAEPGGDPVLALELMADGLAAPVTLVETPDGTGRLLVADQAGLIRVIRDGSLRDSPFLDLRDRTLAGGERGLLGLALHPAFADNGRLFVYYSAPRRAGAPAGWNHTSRIVEFRASAGGDADPASERLILHVDQPQSNHNAGTLAFGPDGFLYISLGDGGGSHDTGLGHPPRGNGQSRDNLLGSILRIDIDGAPPYEIPPDNPFVDGSGRPEIWAYGFRNPYRFSFDRAGANQLIAGDVGQILWEEVDVVTRGGNYGWNLREGFHCFDPSAPGDPPDQCADTGPLGEPLLDAVLEYANAAQPGGIGSAVVGGHVYRGSALPDLAGRYVFGDFHSGAAAPDGSVFAADRSTEPWTVEELRFPRRPDERLGHFLLGFGQDLSGELYILSRDGGGFERNTGRVYRLVLSDG